MTITDMTDMTALERLRARAAQCRRLAAQAYSDGIAAELETLAQDYDQNAAKLEMIGAKWGQIGTPAFGLR